MTTSFPDSLRTTLAAEVQEASDSWLSEPTEPYPSSAGFRADAEHVRVALLQLGYDVPLHVAATFWERYSEHMEAGWLAGPDTVESAVATIGSYCADLASDEN